MFGSITEEVKVGITTIVGWLAFVAGMVPLVIQLLEEGVKALGVNGPAKWAAIIGLVSLAVTNIGRYVQAWIQSQAKGKAEVVRLQIEHMREQRQLSEAQLAHKVTGEAPGVTSA